MLHRDDVLRLFAERFIRDDVLRLFAERIVNDAMETVRKVEVPARGLRTRDTRAAFRLPAYAVAPEQPWLKEST